MAYSDKSDLNGLQLFLDRLLARSLLTVEEQSAIQNLPAIGATVKARHDFVRQNEKVSYCCLVVSGLVGRFGELSSGKRQITAFHIPGDMADLHSAVRPIGVGGLFAISDVKLLKVSHEAIRLAAARYPAIAEALWRDCMVDTAILMQWVVNLGRRPASDRLAYMFCEMSVRYGLPQRPALQYTLPISQEQLGEASGMTGVHVNRSLRTLRDAGLVLFARSTVQIPDWNTLAATIEFDPSYLVGDTGSERQDRLIQDWSAVVKSA